MTAFSRPSGRPWQSLSVAEMVRICTQGKQMHRAAHAENVVQLENLRLAAKKWRNERASPSSAKSAAAAMGAASAPVPSGACDPSPQQTLGARAATAASRAVPAALLIAALSLVGDPDFTAALDSGDYTSVVAQFLHCTGIGACSRIVSEMMLPFVEKVVASSLGALGVCSVVVQLCVMAYEMYINPDSRTLSYAAWCAVNVGLTVLCCCAAPGIPGVVISGVVLQYLRHCRERCRNGDSWFKIIVYSAGDVVHSAWSFVAGLCRCVGQFAQDVWNWDFRSKAQREYDAAKMRAADLVSDEEFHCPVTQSLLVDPVDICGHFFERDVATMLLAGNNPCHPLTRQRITTDDVREVPSEFKELLREYTSKLAQQADGVAGGHLHCE